MTLLAVADRITAGVQRVAQREIIASRMARLKRIEFDLNQLEPLLAEVMSLVQAASSAGLNIPTDLLESLRARTATAALEPDKGGVDTSVLEQLVSDLRVEVSSMKGAVASSWHELVDRKISQPEGLTHLAETFLRLDPDNALALELRQSIAVTQQLTHAAPSTDALHRLDWLAARIPLLLRDLVGDDPSVRSFAEQVGGGGAPLDSLTPEVQRWIASKRLGEGFMIVAGKPES